MSNEQDVITPRDAASILGVHERTVQRLLKQGELPGYKAGLRQWRIRRTDLEAYIRRQSNQARREEQEE
jgi:excisionase family DNA binding protein